MAKILGINDEQTICDCCGKKNLKKTVIIEMDDKIVRYGTSCASKIFRHKEATLKNKANVMEYVRKLVSLNKYTLNQIGMACWNKYGYGFEIKNGKLFINGQNI